MIDIEQQTKDAIEELFSTEKIKEGSLIVVGCSTSEVMGEHIGKGSAPEIGTAIAKVLLESIDNHNCFLAAQCCEHLNRAIVLEKEVAEKLGYDPVCVRPRPKAGGSFASAVYEQLKCPVVVEHVRAKAGLDIGNTLIGMHLADVAVPVRINHNTIGSAHVNAAYCRPKLIGGVRADYPE